MTERFWSWVDTSRGPTGCWLWTGSVFRRGYGKFSVDHKNRRAHRVSWELANGEIPGGSATLVCHRCDNPPCVNPAHLFLGTHQENMADRDLKGRQAKGSHHRNARLSDQDVLEIRALVDAGFRKAVVARLYGVQRSGVSKIVSRQVWRHLPPGQPKPAALPTEPDPQSP